MNDRVFDELVRKHEVVLMTFARSLTRDQWSAEEAVQETLDVPIGTVRSRLGRARQAFSQLLVEAQLASCQTGVA